MRAAADVLKTTVYVASSEQADLVRAWEVIAAAFAPARPPSTLLCAAVLGYTDQLVEIEAVAPREVKHWRLAPMFHVRLRHHAASAAR